MTIHEFAAKLDGREYGNEISTTEERLAKELGFVVVYGYSDDNAEFAGAISNEMGCYGGGAIYLSKDGIWEDCDCKICKALKPSQKVIEAVWSEGDYSWTYKTDIPHATFDILEDGEKYCKGIVFDLNNL